MEPPMEPSARNREGGLSLWKANVLVFACLFLMMILLFLVQLEQTKRLFMEDARSYARLLANVARLHVTNALESQEIMDRIIAGHLRNISSFVAYLDEIDPFSPQELESFSRRTGLYGIAVIDDSGEVVSGVKEWQASMPYRCDRGEGLIRDHEAGLMVFVHSIGDRGGCVIAAIASRDFDMLQAKIGLESAVKSLGKVPGVIGVRLEHDASQEPREEEQGAAVPVVSFGQDGGRPVLSISLPLPMHSLEVELDASIYASSVRRLWRNFMGMAAVVVISGALLSYWLYRRQKMEMARAVQMEQAMARQREEAIIGRAAATIAHEVRNPLNAVYMALQRLGVESAGLDDASKRLLEISVNSIKQANSIIADLMEFSRPISPKREEVDIKALMEEAAYFLGLEQKGIDFTISARDDIIAYVDPRLMRQVILNLLKNAVEAQPEGGFVEIGMEGGESGVEIRISNGGELPSKEELQRLLEPYFTTKNKGTGIGLPFSKRIVNAHGGDLSISIEEGRFCVTIVLPR